MKEKILKFIMGTYFLFIVILVSAWLGFGYFMSLITFTNSSTLPSIFLGMMMSSLGGIIGIIVMGLYSKVKKKQKKK